MGDRSLVKELKRWATEEFNLPAQSLPNDSYFKTLCVGPGASIWKYVTQHVFHQRNVRIMRGNLQWYKVLEDKKLEVEGVQSEAAKRRELQEKMEDLRAEISHLDSQISGTEAQLATEELSISQSCSASMDSQCRAVLLQAFRQRCLAERQHLSQHTHTVSGHCQSLDQLARKGDVELSFGTGSPSSSGNHGVTSTLEPGVLRDVRKLREERVLYFRSLQDRELQTAPSTVTLLSQDERTKVLHHWLSSVEDLVREYPPSQLLSSLQSLASGQQVALEEKMASLNVVQEVTALRFHYQGKHLLDMSIEEEKELPPVKSLLQDAWAEVEQSLVELAQTRSRTQNLQNQLQAQRKQAEWEGSVLGDDSHNSPLPLGSVELELQVVVQSAVREQVKQQCLLVEQQTREKQEALKTLRSQRQRILDFRQLVDSRQEQIRALIRGNSTAKTELLHLHTELGDFHRDKLSPEFTHVIAAASGLRNSVSQEARQFGTVSLAALDRRTVEGVQRVPASVLSIHRLFSSSFSSLCESLDFPLYRAPEALCSLAVERQLELCLLKGLLRLHSCSLEEAQRQQERLPAPDLQALMSRVQEEDRVVLVSLLPRVQTLSELCSQGLGIGGQVQTAISDWWEQPAQHAIPEARHSGLTYQQWLQRWRLAAKPS